MNRSAGVSSLVAAVVILAVIAVAGVAGFYLIGSPSASTNTSQGSSQSSSQSSSQQSSQSTSGSISSSSSRTAGQGTVAMMATDPSTYASGVSKVYVAYSGAFLHSNASGTAGGWVQVNSGGTLELTSIVNQAVTIAVAKVSTGSYDMAKITITSATVTSGGKNYTSTVKQGDVVADLKSRLTVNGSASAGALIDLNSAVVNEGSSASPTYHTILSATATGVASSSMAGATISVGATVNLKSAPWWAAFQSQTQATITLSAAAVSNSSMSITVKNNGNGVEHLKLIMVTPLSIAGQASVVIPANVSSSAEFQANSDGSLTQVHGSLDASLDSAGYTLAAGTSIALSYQGSIKLGTSGTLLGLMSSNQYLVTVIGDEASASTIVTAS
jgi:trimeric autotransporter adhesin